MRATRDDTDRSVIITLTLDEARQLLASLRLAMTHAPTEQHSRFAADLTVELDWAGIAREVASE